MPDRELKIMSLAIAVAVYILAGGWLTLGAGSNEAKANSSRFDDAQTIEASLAFKKIEPKSKQPQKRKKQMFQPTTEKAASKDETATPEPDDENKEHVDPEEIDFSSILDKNRKQDDDLSDTGSDDLDPRDGDENGSELGTGPTNSGDPYEAALKAHVWSFWEIPTLEKGKGTAIGCVRLDESGKIVEVEFKTKSQNSNIDRSVELALKQADGTSLEAPVPAKLKTKLTEVGVCIDFPVQ